MGHGTNSGRTLPGNARQFVPHELDIPRGVTPAQRKVLDRAKAIIDAARTKTFENWARENQNTDLERVRKVWYRDDEAGYERRVATLRNWYEQARSGEALVTAHGPTIRKLEQLGLIQIIKDSTGERNNYALDRIKLLNY